MMLVTVFLVLLAAVTALGQGGPPLLTDDPGTPGNRNWEVNTAFTAEFRAYEHEYQSPVLDINYGVGEYLQLKLQLPWLLHAERNAPSIDGLGNTLVGVKWRFYSDEKRGIGISTYPQLELNNPTNSVRRGLVERGPGFLLPIEITRKLGPLALNAEGGYWFERHPEAKWVAGLAAGHQFSQRVELLTEAYSIGSEAGRDNTWDIGGRVKLWSPVNLLFMAGRSFRSAESGQPKLIGYLGLQWLLPARTAAQSPRPREGETTSAAAESSLKRIAIVDLPGPKGKRFDYLTIDAEHNYLLVSHLAAGLLYVISLNSNGVVATIPDVPGTEGVEYVPELERAYTSDWYENKVAVIDLARMEVLARIPVEEKPDGSTYAAPFHKLYVSDERARAVSVIDVNLNRVVTTLHFKSETGMPQYDSVSRKVLVNLQDEDAIAEIDPVTDSVAARYPVALCRANHGMALDEKHRRAFLVCEGNNRLVVFDLQEHKTMTAVPVPAGGDVVKFDQRSGRVYVACSSGFISVVQEDDAWHFRKLEDHRVQQKVHSLAVDYRTHRVYVPEEQEDGKAVARMIVYEAVPSGSDLNVSSPR